MDFSSGENESYYDRLQKLLHQIERPCVIYNRERIKFMAVYMITHNYLGRICSVLEDNIDQKGEYPYHAYNLRKVNDIQNLPERLIFEKFDVLWINRSKRGYIEENPDFYVAPKCEKLKNIPPDNSRAILTAYQNKDEKPVPVDKDKESKHPREEEKSRESRSKSKSRIFNKVSCKLGILTRTIISQMIQLIFGMYYYYYY